MFTMINNSEFAERLTIIMGFYQLSASAFADKIQVPRSSISHLLSGRNKPSLDFVLKVVKVFEEVELYWLLNGKGSFPNNDPSALPREQLISKTETSATSNVDAAKNQVSSTKKIERIVIFYEDGTFKDYQQ